MKVSAVLLGTLPLASLLGACGGDTQTDGTQVVASFYPFAYVAEQVGGSPVTVDNLTSPGVEPHDVELKPKQVGAVQTADLVIYQRGFQSAVDAAVDEADRSGEEVLDVAEVVALEEAHGDVHEGDDRAHGDLDPHSWLDPRTMVDVTREVEQRLSAADPDHAPEFRKNAKRFTDGLRRLDADFTAGLADCRTRTIVTSHEAFHYLAERYDLTQVPIAGFDPANEPSPAQLADISSLVRREGITTIFTEELVSPAIADTVARETGADTATLDPIEGLSDRTEDETYVTLMRNNLDALRKANSCS
ncbi:MAG: metal ABC transporter substrate-binding protein [Aeromicrobium sp.]